jgi:hypothetical protein
VPVHCTAQTPVVCAGSRHISPYRAGTHSYWLSAAHLVRGPATHSVRNFPKLSKRFLMEDNLSEKDPSTRTVLYCLRETMRTGVRIETRGGSTRPRVAGGSGAPGMQVQRVNQKAAGWKMAQIFGAVYLAKRQQTFQAERTEPPETQRAFFRLTSHVTSFFYVRIRFD